MATRSRKRDIDYQSDDETINEWSAEIVALVFVLYEKKAPFVAEVDHKRSHQRLGDQWR